MQGARVEVFNHPNAGTVIVARFETAGDAVGTMQVAGGSRQVFEEFDRLTVSAPETTGDLRLLNQGNVPLALRHETHGGHLAERQLSINGFDDIKVAQGDQLYITAGSGAGTTPERPILDHAVFEPEFPSPPYSPNQKPPNFLVRLRWSHPDEGSGKIIGYNLYRGYYHGNQLNNYEVLNGPPHIGTCAEIYDVMPPLPFNHRYAVTAIGQSGQESLLSNVRILDANVRHHLIDAGFILI